MLKTKLILASALGLAISACGSNPTIGMNPEEIANHLGYAALAPGASVPSNASYNIKQVNSKAVVFDYGGGREYLVTFGQICLGIRSGGNLKTTSTDRMLESGDSVVIDGQEYCRIEEIYSLRGKAE